MIPERPAWIEVDLRIIAENVRAIRAMLSPQTALMAVVKANGYGHGAIPIARTVLNAGAALLGVTCLDEALELRRAGISAGILMLGYAPPEHADRIVEFGIIANCYSIEVLDALDSSARRSGAVARVHLKVDTGMGRLGPFPETFARLVERAFELKNVRVEGIFTHFASADDPNSAQTDEQLSTFRRVVTDAAGRGFRPRYLHAANSAATIARAESHFNLVRVGAAMYGMHPSSNVRCPKGVRPALTFKAMVAQVKDVPAGTSISYGATYQTSTPRRIAVLQVGYADGFRRSPMNWGDVLIHGRRAPVVGVVCMDMCMCDVSEIAGVEAGDEAVLLGTQAGDHITFEDIAFRTNTISYEVACQLASRLPRVYLPELAPVGVPEARPYAGISRDGSSVQSR